MKEFEEALYKFYSANLNNTDIMAEDVKNLLDSVRRIYNLNIVYIVENDDFLKHSSFVIISDGSDEWYQRQDITLSENVYGMLHNIYDDEGLSEVPFISDMGGTPLHYVLLCGDYNFGCIGMRANDGHVWSDEERMVLKLMARAVKPYVTMRRYGVERKKAEMIRKLAENYDVLYHLNIKNNKVIVIHSIVDNLKEGEVLGGFSHWRAEIKDKYVKPDYVEGIYSFIELHTLSSRLEKKERIAYEFEGNSLGWCRAEIIPIAYSDGVLTDAFFAVQVIDEERMAQIQEQISEREYFRSEQKRSRIREKTGEDLFGHYMDMVGCGVMTYSVPERELLFMNGEARRMYNITDDQTDISTELLKKKMSPVNYAGNNSLLDVENKVQKPGDSSTFDFNLHNADGSISRITAHSRMVEGFDGRKLVIGTMMDITRQYELAKELEFERAQYRDSIINHSVMALLFDVTANIVTEDCILKSAMKDKSKELSKYFPMSYDLFVDYWLKMAKPKFTGENIAARDYLLDLYENGQSSAETEFHYEKNDSYYRLMVMVTKREDDGHLYAFINAVNITQLRKAEMDAKAKMKEALDDATKANQAKTEFLSRMSHDIRTPMNAIVGMTSIAKANIDNTERVENCLDKISASSEHLLTLINEVLDMRRIESGMLKMTEEPLMLSDVVEGVLVLINPQVRARGHVLNIYNKGLIHEEVFGDALHLRQILTNILGNAVKYTPDGGKISFSIGETILEDGVHSMYEFVIEDNGVGMSREYIDKLFQPFTREEDSRTNHILGTGLGMTIAKKFIEELHGTIDVDSIINKGTRFTVRIPMRYQDDTEFDESELKGLSVLVVDDEQMVCESACMILDDIGLDSQWTLSGYDAVERVKAAHYKNDDYFAVIVDWMMPGMDGIQTAREIRKHVGKDVPIIVLTAYDWSDVEEEARKAGVNAFIQKPMFRQNMVLLLKNLKSGVGINNDVSRNEEKLYTGKKVLLVEDQEFNMEIAHEFLDMAGVEVEEAENGAEAVRLFMEKGEGYFDLVFMDVQMPIMNGYEATKVIRNMGTDYAANIPIIAMTANVFSKDVQDAENAGMSGHVSKPVELRKFKKVLAEWIR